MSDEEIEKLLGTAEKRNISNVQILLDEENKNISASKKVKLTVRPKGVNDISSFFHKKI